MTATRDQLSALRRSLSDLEKAQRGSLHAGHDQTSSGGGGSCDRVRLDHGSIDTAAGGGLARAALHEIVAERAADAPAARGLAVAMAQRAAGIRTLVWTGHDQTMIESGHLSPDGLNGLGLDPARVLVLQARDATTALRAAVEAAKCPAAGAVVSEIWGVPKALDLNATRRLRLAAQGSGVMVVLARLGVTPQPSAAETRWGVAATASRALAAGAPGRPAFVLTLLRHRHGVPAGPWFVEWNSHDGLLHVQDIDDAAASGRVTAHPGNRAAASGNGPAATLPRQRVLRLA
jgi:protein ImuA